MARGEGVVTEQEMITLTRRVEQWRTAVAGCEHCVRYDDPACAFPLCPDHEQQVHQIMGSPERQGPSYQDMDERHRWLFAFGTSALGEITALNYAQRMLRRTVCVCG